MGGADLAVHPASAWCSAVPRGRENPRSSRWPTATTAATTENPGARGRDGDRRRLRLAPRDPVLAPAHDLLRVAVPPVIPRIGAREVVAAAGREGGMAAEVALARAEELLSRLNLPERLWTCRRRPFPAASSSGSTSPAADRRAADPSPRRAHRLPRRAEPRRGGGADPRPTGGRRCPARHFHDTDVREAVATRVVDVTAFAQKRAA